MDTAMKSSFLLSKKLKAFLMLEAALAVLVVTVISLFIFRGFSLFTRAARKNMIYTELVLLSGNQAESIAVWHNLTDGNFDKAINQRFSRQIIPLETSHSHIAKYLIRLENVKSKEKLDTILYLEKIEDEE